MAKSKQKYYVVWKGVDPGIYGSWTECQQQIKGYPGAEYKSFKTLEEATIAFGDSYDEHKTKKSSLPNVLSYQLNPEINQMSIAVDAACSGNPGLMEYRGVDLESGLELFHQGPFEMGTNNVGEFLALVHILALSKKENLIHKAVYSDSRIAIGWIEKRTCRTKLKRTPPNDMLFQLISRAENWLRTNTIEQTILKWETKKWGEIPADFGRK